MMFDGTSVRSAALWVSLGVLAGGGITLGVILVGGVSVADEAGSPVGISVVTVAPNTSPTGVAPTGIPTHSSDDDAIEVPAPTPTEVELDDDRDDSGSGSNSGSDNSGSGSSGSGSGSDDAVDSD